MEKTKITVETIIDAPLDVVWECWTEPKHIIHWNFASDEWCCPRAENDAKSGGAFNWRMEAKDGSMGFDFNGIYEEVKDKVLITYKLGDDRVVEIHFKEVDDGVRVTETFEAEGTNSDEMQRSGWQAILGNFKKYTESQA